MKANLKNILIVALLAVAALAASIAFSPKDMTCDQSCQDGFTPATAM